MTGSPTPGDPEVRGAGRVALNEDLAVGLGLAVLPFSDFPVT